MAPPSPDDPLPDPLLTAIKRLRPCRSEFDPGRFVLSPVLCHPVRIIRGCSVPMRPPGFHLQASRDKPVVHFGPARCRWVEHRRIGLIVRCSTWRDGCDGAEGEGQLGTARADELGRNLRPRRDRGPARSPVLGPVNRSRPLHRSCDNGHRGAVPRGAPSPSHRRATAQRNPERGCGLYPRQGGSIPWELARARAVTLAAARRSRRQSRRERHSRRVLQGASPDPRPRGQEH